MTTRNTADFYARTAAYYDAVGPYVARPDIGFFVDEAKASGGPVLEIGCGTGRVLVPTARAGITITGLDNSKAMLDVCRDRVSREPADVRDRIALTEGDMRDFDLDASFALITLPFRPFQHLLEVPDQMACLKCLRRHLMPKGRLILDVFNPILSKLDDDSAAAEYEAEPPADLPEGGTLVRSARVAARDLARQTLTIDMRYDVTHADGHTERIDETVVMRYFFRYELEHLLARCGFAIEAVYSDYERNPFGVTYPGEILILARPA